VPSQITTTDANPATLWSATPSSGTNMWFEAVVTAREAGDANVAAYVRYVHVRRSSNGGIPTIVGSVGAPFTSETNNAWDCIFAIVGNDVVLRVTGAAGANITWTLHSMRSFGNPLGTFWDAR
jgi:hypothetical protein